MKRSRLSYDEWQCIKSKKLKGKQICSDFFNGYIGLLEIEEALSAKDITQEQFHLAISTSDKLKSGLLRNINTFIKYTLRCKEIVEK